METRIQVMKNAIETVIWPLLGIDYKDSM